MFFSFIFLQSEPGGFVRCVGDHFPLLLAYGAGFRHVVFFLIVLLFVLEMIGGISQRSSVKMRTSVLQVLRSTVNSSLGMRIPGPPVWPQLCSCDFSELLPHFVCCPCGTWGWLRIEPTLTLGVVPFRVPAPLRGGFPTTVPSWGSPGPYLQSPSPSRPPEPSLPT